MVILHSESEEDPGLHMQSMGQEADKDYSLVKAEEPVLCSCLNAEQGTGPLGPRGQGWTFC